VGLALRRLLRTAILLPVSAGGQGFCAGRVRQSGRLPSRSGRKAVQLYAHRLLWEAPLMIHLALVSAVRTVATAAHIVLLLVIELVATMLIYIYLNLYHLSTFGYLIRLSRSVLDALTGQLEYWLPVSSNVAYATLIGELGPKSIMLLMLGLLTATVIRGIARGIGRLVSRRATPKPEVAAT
jgi:hypothetical protein